MDLQRSGGLRRRGPGRWAMRRGRTTAIRFRFLPFVAALLMLAALPAWAGGKVTLNFKDADIKSVIKFVSEFTGKNFLVDNRVRGTVSIVSPTPISEKDAYDVFLSVLEMNGFAAVPSGKVIKIIPRAEGKQKTIPVLRNQPRANDDLVTEVIALHYANAAQLVAILRPLIAPVSHLVAYPASNLLLLTDSAANIAKIRKIIAIVDQPKAVSVRIFELQYASAAKLAATLNALYGTVEKAEGMTPVALKALAHDPGNLLIVIADPQRMDDVAEIVARLDVRPETDAGRLQVIYLKHANATDVAKTLTSLTGGRVVGKPGQKKVLFSGNIKVVADPSTNALLVTAGPDDMRAIKSIIAKLDIRRLQVLIEALVVEVSGNDAEQLGIDWLAGKPIKNNTITIFGGQNDQGTFGKIGAAVAANNGTINNAAAAAAALPGFSVGVLQGDLNAGSITLGAIAQAIESTTHSNLLSTPTILTMDNEEAQIVVGQNVPFITGTNATQGGVANPFQTIQRKDIGLTLKVKPQISEGDTVRLEIYQEVSSISNSATATTGASDLITNKRSIKTVALVRDGEILVLGGLMRSDERTAVKKVPCLGSVPLLGEPFKFTDDSRTKTNLMVFLRPKIIRSEDDIRTVTQDKYLDIKRLYKGQRSGGSILIRPSAHHFPESWKPTPPSGKGKPKQPPTRSAPTDGYATP
ncbi:MAG: type II secretion system protein GspD [Zetaproteobacteria bacterium]|nr:MAG: type II secretion system protein GspD [Zetaproteobacteria bacterium]